MKILVTGFEPFGGESRNPSAEVVNAQPDRIAGADIVKLILPVERFECVLRVEEAVRQHFPRVVLSIGQAGGRAAVTVEQMAVNLEDYSMPDNGGNQPVDVPVRADGPAAYFSTLPVKAMVQAMKQAGVPASVSNTAGTFVCNDLMYRLLDHLTMQGREIPAGFIHIPATPAQAAERPSPSLSPETVAKGLEAALSVLIMK